MGSRALSFAFFLMLLCSHSGLTQDRPEVVLSVDPKSVSTGETVTLKCLIESNHSDWRYAFYKQSYSLMLQTTDRYTVNRDTLTIKRVNESDQDQYWCSAQRDGRPQSSQSSSFAYLIMKDLPTSTLTVTPKRLVFTEETVTLKCVIESQGNWRYEWYKGSIHNPVLQSSDGFTVNRDTLTIRRATESDQDYYWCRGQRDERPQSSQSNCVFLYVYDSPSSTLTVTPDSPVFTGERVTLKCVIESYSDWTQRNRLTYDSTNDWTYNQTPEWRYEWYKGSVKLQSSDGFTVNGDTLTIRGATGSDQGQYWCRGQRDKRPQSSQSSSAAYLSVKVNPYSYTARQKPVVKVTPAQRVFRGEIVTLTCDIQQTENIQWTYSWFKHRYSYFPFTRTTTTAEFSFTASESDGGEYTCRGERSDSEGSYPSDAVTLTVSDLKPKPELTSYPAGAALTGNTVTLTCLMDPVTGWDFYWYKHTLNSETETQTNSYSMKIDSVSDGGQYWCRAGRGKPVYFTQYSDALWVNVTGHPLNITEQHNGSGQISVLHILSFLLAACPYLLATVVLLVKYYRVRVSSAEDQSQYAVTQETST